MGRALDGFPAPYVFVGGAVLPFLITDPASSNVRPTDDIDLVVPIATRADYYEIEDWLRNNGFDNHPDGPICRWALADHLVDVMPTDEGVLGFSNRWYDVALKTAFHTKMEDGFEIPIVRPVVFIATKLAAFENRGEEDYYASHDLEDIVTLLDGRPELVDEFETAPQDVWTYVIDHFIMLLADGEFEQALPGHLPYGPVAGDRADIVRERMEQIVAQN